MNKGQIRAHFIALLNRSDCSDALADTFIDQALTRVQRVLRIPPMESIKAYPITSGTPLTFVIVPSDLIEIIDIQYEGVSLLRLPLNEMAAAQQANQTGSPVHFTRERGIIKLSPHPTSGTVLVNYYALFPDLIDDADENVLTQIAVDLIAYTALSYASDYFLDERGPLFEGKARQFLDEIQNQANSAETSGMSQVMRPTSIYTD